MTSDELMAAKIASLERQHELIGERIEEHRRRIAALEVDGSPNLRERVKGLEVRVGHLVDPESGVYARITSIDNSFSERLNRGMSRLTNWAIVLLTALLLNVALILAHFAFAKAIP